MNPKFVTHLLFVFCASCSTQQNISKLPSKTKKYIISCADSINHIKDGSAIPSFLLNPCFDYQRQYWIHTHNQVPLRKLIIDRVKNKEAIQYTLFSAQANELKIICDKGQKRDTVGLNYIRIPLIKESFADLLKDRLWELINL